MNDAAPHDFPTRLTARALLVGDRIDTAGLERPDMISSVPLAFRAGDNGMVALFRFGVAVMVGLTPLEEEDLLAQLNSRITGLRARLDDETAILEIAPDTDEPSEAGGPIQIKNFSPQRFLVVADALAKNAVSIKARRDFETTSDKAVRERLAAVTPEMYNRKSPFPARLAAQNAVYQLPTFRECS